MQDADHSAGARAHQAQHHPAKPPDASSKRSLILTTDGPDTPLHSPPIGLKSFGDGQVIVYRNRSASAKTVVTAKRIDPIENRDRT